jgi:hypothetical protein
LDILADVPAQLTAMNASITKQSVAGGQGGKVQNDDDRPMPINFGAAEAQKDLMLELAKVTRRIRHCLPEGTCPSYPGIPKWITGLMPRIVNHPEAVDWYNGIRTAYEKTVKAIDLPPEQVRAGTCGECNAPLYTAAGNEKVRCRPCGISYDVANLQGEMLERVLDYNSTAQQVVRVMTAAGIPMKLTRLTKWADRRQVAFTDSDIGRIFTVRDVLETHKAMSKGSEA